MKRKKLFAVAMALVVALSVSITAFATARTVTKNLTYRNIKITLNGTTITPKDANGNTIEPFIIDGTTYLPVRGIASVLGITVGWDDKTSTITLSTAKKTIGEGMYLVGKDIPAGTYKVTTTDKEYGGYWKRCSDASGSFDSIIANGLVETSVYVKVSAGEYFYISDCTATLQ